MRYAYKDLGYQQAGTAVTVHLQGSATNVLLLDSKNLAWYRVGLPFMYTGGYYLQSPVRLEIPRDGHWYVVLDHGGYTGHVRGSVEVESAEDSRDREPRRSRKPEPSIHGR